MKSLSSAVLALDVVYHEAAALLLVDCPISDNRAANGAGGAIFSDGVEGLAGLWIGRAGGNISPAVNERAVMYSPA